MAATTQDDLYKAFLQISGQQASALSDVTMTLSDVVAQVQEMRADVPPPNSRSTSSSSTSQANSTEGTLASVASTVLKSGFGLAPLVSGLVSLFGGGDPPAPAPLIKYALPVAVNFQAVETASGITGLDYDQSGGARAYRAGSAVDMQRATNSAANTATGSPATTSPAPQITVNVQAMDARSFLDRSNDIALAVRDAMLNMNAINDVVSEL